MYKVLTLNNISEKGINKLLAENFQVADKIQNPDGILVRSYEMKDMELPESLLAIARAGAGTNNIPVAKCSEKGIVVFYAPGANANAVKELVITGILISSRKIVEGIEWTRSLKGQKNVDKLVENGKAKFAGPEISGKTLGVIGLGAIGVLVANAAIALGMKVIGFDPYLSIDSAWSLSSSVTKADDMAGLVSKSDYITLHIPLNDKTRGMFGKELFSKVKPGARILNFSRGEIVDIAALKEAIDSNIIESYITDFPSDDLLDIDRVILIPHLGASTPESEEHCAEMAAAELRDYLEYGKIKNSVNFPDCEEYYYGKTRVSIIHKNIPGMVSSIANAFSAECINIENLINKSKGDWAYTLVDIDGFNGRKDSILEAIDRISGVVAIRVVKEEN